LGVPVDAPFTNGDPYYGVPVNSTALQVAAWRARHGTVKLLIERGAAVGVADANGRTPLALAVRAAVDSYWIGWRSPESVAALLAAGASAAGIHVPTGYADTIACWPSAGETPGSQTVSDPGSQTVSDPGSQTVSDPVSQTVCGTRTAGTLRGIWARGTRHRATGG